MRKVVFISYVYLTEKYSRDWNIDHLIANGATVEYWDIVAMTRGAYVENHRKTAGYVRAINTFPELEVAIRLPENRNAIYFMMLPYSENFIRVFRLINKYNRQMIGIAWGGGPDFSEHRSRRLIKHLAHPLLLAKKIFAKVRMSTLVKAKFLYPYDTLFVAGEAMAANPQFAKKVVPINLVDYDHYMRVRQGKRLTPAGRNAVFLDINLPHQSDLLICGLPVVAAKAYYHSLNRFFDLVESQFELKIVIAAHPKSDYDESTFHGRTFYRDRTAELVRDTEFVITHTSTALSYAILNLKPVLFIHTDEMLSLYENTVMRQLRAYSKYLDAPLLNIDRISDAQQIEIGAPRTERYERYKYDYLTTCASENTTTADIFLNELRTMHA